MLLAIDVGNTQTVYGLFDEAEKMINHWRLSTNDRHTADEKSVEVTNILMIEGIKPADINGLVISSVVPECTDSLVAMSKEFLKLEPLLVRAADLSGIKIEYDRPDEIGSDRIINALAGYRMFGGPLIIVDFGTATTFDIVSKVGAYVGGVISPGLEISAKALFRSAAKLSRIEMKAPSRVIGSDTVTSIQSGIIYGTAAMVDGMVGRIKEDTNSKYKVVATGGVSELIAPFCRNINHTEPFLTLLGLQMAYRDIRG